MYLKTYVTHKKIVLKKRKYTSLKFGFKLEISISPIQPITAVTIMFVCKIKNL